MSNCVTGGLFGRLRSDEELDTAEVHPMAPHTVDTIAAGTLAMMDMTALRSSNMKMVASRLAKNLRCCQSRFWWGRAGVHARYQEVYQAVTKDQGD